MSMKNSNETIGIRTCDLPVRSAVPQPAVPPRVGDISRTSPIRGGRVGIYIYI